MSETPMPQEQLAEIQRRRAAVADAPWGSCRDLDGAYTVQAGALVGSAGFDSSGDVAHVVAEDEKQGFQRATFIARAPVDIDALLAEVEHLRAEVERLHRSVDDQLETIQEAAAALAERGDELRSLRAELDAHPSRAEALREAAEFATKAARAQGDSEVGQYASSVAAVIGRQLRELADVAEQGETGGSR